MKVEGLLLDYGGTLDIPARHWYYIFEEAYKAVGIEVSRESLRQAYVAAERTLAKEPIIEPQDDFMQLLQKKVRVQVEALPVDISYLKMNEVASYCDCLVRENLKETRKVLAYLQERYPLVLVTNFYGNIHQVLKAYRLDHFFHEVIESATVGVRKPDKAIYRMGCDALGFPPERVCMIGDSWEKDIVPAAMLGCKTIWLEGEQWNPASSHETIWSPSVTIHHLQELQNDGILRNLK